MNTPPFPSLTWNDYSWNAQITLTSWAGFQSRLGPYDTIDSTEPSTGLANLHVDTGNDSQDKPSTEQVAAYTYLLQNEQAIADAILAAIMEVYPKWQKDFGYDEAELAEYMPNIQQPAQLKDLMGLTYVHILPTTKDGIAYIGFEFGCTWDDEHALGLMTHCQRIIDIGYADISFDNWIARRDAQVGQENPPEAGTDSAGGTKVSTVPDIDPADDQLSFDL